MILIGSRAIKKHFPDFRDCKDYDYAVFYGDGIGRETEKDEDGNRHEFQNIPPLTKRYRGSSASVTPDHLYTLKVSHIFWPIKQRKHLGDIKFLRDKGCVIDWELFEELFAYWTDVHGPNTTIDFDKPNDEFFVDYVKREHDHDELHTLINPEPLYLLAKEDRENANISEKIFATLPMDVRLDIVWEEGYVLALERLLIRGHEKHWRVAYAKMIRHMICKLTPRWLGLFIVNNYHEILKPKFNFYEHYKQHKHELRRNNQEI